MVEEAECSSYCEVAEMRVYTRCPCMLTAALSSDAQHETASTLPPGRSITRGSGAGKTREQPGQRTGRHGGGSSRVLSRAVRPLLFHRPLLGWLPSRSTTATTVSHAAGKVYPLLLLQ